jgi:hypothetical protein
MERNMGEWREGDKDTKGYMKNDVGIGGERRQKEEKKK